MDWYLGTEDHSASSALRREIRDYLRRHAASDDGLADAEVVVAELLTNALRHTSSPAWVSLTWGGNHPVLTVYDLGPGFVLDPTLPGLESLGGRGLFLVDQMASELSPAAREAGGAKVSATLPVERPPSPSYDPPRRIANALPSLDESGPEGFGKEPFLRALVVQLAQAVEGLHGPAAAEAAVAQVGSDVGGQMELEYRAATEVVGRMDPEVMADCFVRLKHAIDGGFHVIEAGPDRIVMGNDRCPFGDAVKMAPALCRMTSSVFGGIAARGSNQRAAIVLEERIAVGDPRCRVVIHLDPIGDLPPNAHLYRTPV